MQVSRVSNSLSYDFRNVRAWMIESNNEMHEGQNQRWEIDFNCVKPHLHPELLIVPQTRDIFLLPGSSGQSFAKLWMNDLSGYFQVSKPLCVASQVALVVKNLHTNAGDVRLRLDPSVRRIPWSRAWQPTPVFSLENPMDRGAWWATAHRVAKRQIWLKWLSTHASLCVSRVEARTPWGCQW